MDDNGKLWLAKKKYEEINAHLRSAWELYLKFYTVFLTVNLGGLGLVVQYVDPQNRWPIVGIFVFLNVLSSITSIRMGIYSRSSSLELRKIAQYILDEDYNADNNGGYWVQSPAPVRLLWWGGIANCVGSLALIVCWIVVMRIPSP